MGITRREKGANSFISRMNASDRLLGGLGSAVINKHTTAQEGERERLLASRRESIHEPTPTTTCARRIIYLIIKWPSLRANTRPITIGTREGPVMMHIRQGRERYCTHFTDPSEKEPKLVTLRPRKGTDGNGQARKNKAQWTAYSVERDSLGAMKRRKSEREKDLLSWG